MNVIIFGPPGAGKGTQANNIVKKFNLYQISTGDLLRNEVKNQTTIGKDIENIISKGDFATDEIVNELIKNEIFNCFAHKFKPFSFNTFFRFGIWHTQS